MILPQTIKILKDFKITKFGDKTSQSMVELPCRFAVSGQQVLLNSGEYATSDAKLLLDNTEIVKAGYGAEYDDVFYTITDVRSTINLDGSLKLQYCLLTRQNLTN